VQVERFKYRVHCVNPAARGKEHKGSDDWRIESPSVTPAMLHSILDCLFRIDPDTLKVEVRERLNPAELCLTEPTLQPIRGRPHLEALRWKRDKDQTKRCHQHRVD